VLSQRPGRASLPQLSHSRFPTWGGLLGPESEAAVLGGAVAGAMAWTGLGKLVAAGMGATYAADKQGATST
jgi:hypothetical protein